MSRLGSIKRNEISMGVSAQELRNYKMKNIDCETISNEEMIQRSIQLKDHTNRH